GQGLLPDERLRVLRVFPHQSVRARVLDSSRDGADHVRDHVRLRQADGEGGGGALSVAATAVRRRRNPRRIAGRVGINAVALAVFVVMIFPVYWMVSTAFKTGPNIFSYTPTWFPAPATLA